MSITLTKTFGTQAGGPVTIDEIAKDYYVFKFPDGTMKVSVDNNYATITFTIEGFKEEWEQYKTSTIGYSMYDIMCHYLYYIESFLITEEYYPNDISLDLKDKLFLKRILANFDDIYEQCDSWGEPGEETKERIMDGGSFSPMIYMFNCDGVQVPDGAPINAEYDPSVDYSEFWEIE